MASVSTGQVSADTEASLAMAEDAVLAPDTGTVNINEADAETIANQLLGIGLRRA
jgi:DNA uptake protein ComE-like DNA-binding protein